MDILLTRSNHSWREGERERVSHVPTKCGSDFLSCLRSQGVIVYECSKNISRPHGTHVARRNIL